MVEGFNCEAAETTVFAVDRMHYVDGSTIYDFQQRVLPGVADVRQGVGYGLHSTEFVGSLIAYLPAPAAGDPKRQQILTAVGAVFSLITTANGYNTNIGQHVYVYKPRAFEAGELPGMDIRDSHKTSQGTVGEEHHELEVSVTAVEDGDLSPETLRDIEADIVTAIGVDRTWGGLAVDTSTLSVGQASVQVGERVVSGAKANFTIEYYTENMNPYQ